MTQALGNPNFQYTGEQKCTGINGPVCVFAGRLDPNSFSDPVVPTSAAINPPVTPGVQVAQFGGFARVTVNTADIGSLFLLAGVGLFVKTGFDATGVTSGTWTQVAVP
jgi:hypothetical protein